MTATEKRRLTAAQKAAAAREAGAKARTAQPVNRIRRIAAYKAPGGRGNATHADLTPRQRRRVPRKARHAGAQS